MPSDASTSPAVTCTVATARTVGLRAVDLTRRFADRTVLDGVSLVASDGDRLGLVGENGAGKSTLLRLLAGADVPDAGSVHVGGTLGFLPQTVDVDRHVTVGALLDDALREVLALRARSTELEQAMARHPHDGALLAAYGEALEAFERREGWSAPARLDAAVQALGVAHLERDRRLEAVSGGQRSRLALAALLVARDDVLLLDEPTTHLDDEAVAFLEAQLRSWPGAMLVASHDRAFLDAVCTAVLDLDPSRDGGLTRYGGSYTDYRAAQADERRRWERAFADWQDEVDRLAVLARPAGHRIGHDREPRDNDKFIGHFLGQRQDATLARRVRDAQVRLDRLRAEPVPRPPAPLRFRAPEGADVRRDGVLVAARDVDVPGRVRLPALDVAHDTRLLVTGPNGAGKSSLLAVLAGELAPCSGRVLRACGVRVGLLAQEVRWADPSRNALSAFASGRTGDVEEHVRGLLEVGVLHPRELRTPVGRLSVGQQRRVALARLLTDVPHVLLLDEPTDHLSLSLVEELEEALAARPGALVVVSHDRWLRRRWDGDRLALAPAGGTSAGATVRP